MSDKFSVPNADKEQLIVVVICSSILIGLLVCCRRMEVAIDCSIFFVVYGALCICQSVYQVVLSIINGEERRRWTPRVVIIVGTTLQILSVLLYTDELLTQKAAIVHLLVVLNLLNIITATVCMRRRSRH